MNCLYLEKKKINNEIVDTLILARDKFPGSPVSLDALCKRYRIDNSNSSKVSYFKKVVKPSEDEILKHNEYLKNHLKKNYF